MKKISKITVLLGILLLVLLATVSCSNIFGELLGGNEESTTPETTTPETTTPETTTPETTTQPHAHTFGAWATTQNATCTEKGLQEASCACGEKETQEINALGHTEMADGAIANTCTTDGLTAGSHCSVCGEVFVAQELILAAHDWMQLALLESATCFTYGEERRSCRVCGVVENAPVEPLKHNFVLNEETQLHTCTLCNGILFAGHIYALFTEQCSWSDAKTRCEDLGGHLVTVTSEEETTFITSYLDRESLYGTPVWLGLYRIDNQWYWVTDELVEYTNWNPGEPSNTRGEEYTVCINYVNVDTYRDNWVDISAANQYAYICEFECEE